MEDRRIKPIYKIFSYLLAVSMIINVPSASAQLNFTQDDLDKIYVNQAFRSPVGDTLACTSIESTDPGLNAEQVWRLFADKLTAPQIAGIIGNMTAESGVQPQRLQGTGSGVITPAENVNPSTGVGWGLVQWTPARKIIGAFDPASGANTIENQIKFLWDQLEGRGPSSEKTAGDQLKATTDVRSATIVFAEKYERPAGSASDKNATAAEIESFAKSLEFRISAANGAFERFSTLIPTVTEPLNGPSGSGVTGYSADCAPTDSGIIGLVEAELAKNPQEFDENVLKYTDGNQEPWNANFVSWIFKEAGKQFSGGLSGGWRRPSVRDMQAMFQNEDDLTYFAVGEAEVQVGDIAFYSGDQTIGSSNTQHVDIVVSVDNDSMVTIGGDDGDTVKQNTRSMSLGSDSLVGFGRVK